MLSIHPLTDIGEVTPGMSLGALLVCALEAIGGSPQPYDILVVTQKIVSKSEGLFVTLADVVPGTEAKRIAALTAKDPRLVELVLAESVAVVRAEMRVLITQHRSGHIMANAGIDQSNLGPGREGQVLLLPPDPDSAAAGLRAQLAAIRPPAPAIIVSDSFGRPWRQGTVNVAIGTAGFPAIWDRRGEPDRDGRRMEVTQIALADAVAASAGLVTGEADEGIPAVLVRGLHWHGAPSPATAVFRPLDEDLFR